MWFDLTLHLATEWRLIYSTEIALQTQSFTVLLSITSEMVSTCFARHAIFRAFIFEIIAMDFCFFFLLMNRDFTNFVVENVSYTTS